MKNHQLILKLLLLILIFGRCAKTGSLSGGYRDEDPPIVLSSNPNNYSVNFNTNKIEIEFDEYIALKNVNQELIISPPLPKKPVVRTKNKSIVIDLKNELRPNTTYTLNFGKAIADFNEGNSLTNYEFVFSTGPVLDSLSMQGLLLNAATLLPSKDPFIVGLYETGGDSVPLQKIPVYIGKTNEKGLYQINNIKADTYRLFALKDLNYNLLYDLPTEEIAYLDTFLIITPEFINSLPKRKAPRDTTNNNLKRNVKNSKDDRKPVLVSPQDSLKLDSISPKYLPSIYVQMFSFLPEVTRQYITNSERSGRENFQLSFSLPLTENPPVKLLNYSSGDNWFISEISANRDTFTYWIADTSIVKLDTLKLEVQYPTLDSTGQTYIFSDTLKFITRKLQPKNTKGKETKVKEVKMVVSTTRNGGTMDFNMNFPLNFNFPLAEADTSLIRLYFRKDTIDILQKFRFIRDSVNLRQAEIESNWKEKAKYRIQFLPSAFKDIYDHKNDSTEFKFSIQDNEFYGKLILSLEHVKNPLFIEVLNEKDKVIRKATTDRDEVIIFEYMQPGKYKVRFTNDLNRNGKWDTGNYLKKQQPEGISFYIGEISIRSNWELKINQSF